MDIFDYIINKIFFRMAEDHPILTIMVILLIIFLIIWYFRLRV